MQVTVTDTDGGSPGWPGMPETLLQGKLAAGSPAYPAVMVGSYRNRNRRGSPWTSKDSKSGYPPPPIRNSQTPLASGCSRATCSATSGIGPSRIPVERPRRSPMIGITERSDGTVQLLQSRGSTRGRMKALSLTPLQQSLLGSTWIFDITFRTPDSGIIKLTIRRGGEPSDHSPPVPRPEVRESASTDTFPTELLLPDDPPPGIRPGHHRSADRARDHRPRAIGQNDIQTFLVHNAGPQPASYSPGDWLEPKDGGDQRMMVVASGQPAPAGPSAPGTGLTSCGDLPCLQGWATLSNCLPYRSPGPPPPRQQAVSPSLTPISVVCMQRERDVPLRGARYFSQSKAAEGEVQLCQKNCATAGGEAIQRCVWDCETDPSGETYAPTPVWTVRAGQVRLANLTAGGCIAHNAITSSKWQRRDDETALGVTFPARNRPAASVRTPLRRPVNTGR